MESKSHTYFPKEEMDALLAQSIAKIDGQASGENFSPDSSSLTFTCFPHLPNGDSRLDLGTCFLLPAKPRHLGPRLWGYLVWWQRPRERQIHTSQIPEHLKTACRLANSPWVPRSRTPVLHSRTRIRKYQILLLRSQDQYPSSDLNQFSKWPTVSNGTL